MSHAAVVAGQSSPGALDAAEAQRLVYEAWTAGDLYTARRLALAESAARPSDPVLAEYDARLALTLSDAEGAAAAAARLRASGAAPERCSALEQETAALSASDGDGARSVSHAKQTCAVLGLVVLVLFFVALSRTRAGAAGV